MKRTYNEHDLEQAIRRTAPGESPRSDFGMWKQKHAGAVAALSSRTGERANHDPSITWVVKIGRSIMRKREVKFGTAAAVILIALAAVYLNRATSTAWSMDQTIAAIERVTTLQTKGVALWGPDSRAEPVTYSFWIQPPSEDSPVKMRFECEKRIIVIQGSVVYECWPEEGVAKVRRGPEMTDLKYWYKAAELTPWLTDGMLKTLQQFAEDWKQVVDTDPVTGKRRIVVTCSYPPSNTSFFLVVDAESKLIRSARLWDNLSREGEPVIDAQTFLYNQELPDALFEVPAGMTIVDAEREEESEALFDQAERLFHQEKKHAEALDVYRQVYEMVPLGNMASSSLMMMGICYGRLGQRDKAIETFQQAIEEYPEGWAGVIQFYLGRAYMDNGQTQEALKAFEDCLADGEGERAPDQFPLKDAREYIAQIKGQ